MKTTENLTTFTIKNLENHGQQKFDSEIDAFARPLRSLRPMKSLGRTKSFKPTRIELLAKKRKVAKGI